MSDMIAIFGVLLIIGLGFPALLFLVWLAFPASVDRAQQRVARTPLRCFWLGVVVALLLTVPILILLNLPGAGQFVGALLILIILTISTLGAAGVAAHLGERIGRRNQDAATPHIQFLIGATTLELAVAFPGIGWLVTLPIVLLVALGATTFVLLRRQAKAIPEPHALSLQQAA
jgi:hypothetical protein